MLFQNGIWFLKRLNMGVLKFLVHILSENHPVPLVVYIWILVHYSTPLATPLVIGTFFRKATQIFQGKPFTSLRVSLWTVFLSFYKLWDFQMLSCSAVFYNFPYICKSQTLNTCILYLPFSLIVWRQVDFEFTSHDFGEGAELRPHLGVLLDWEGGRAWGNGCHIFSLLLTVFLAPLPEVQCPNFLDIWRPWGKLMERSGLRFENFCS